ncbi:MAG: tetratricopeptide repeat protein [Vicinamibacterales bacterium]
MYLRGSCLLVVCLAGSTIVAPERPVVSAAAQGTAQPSTDEKLKRIGGELFARGDRAEDAVRELKEVLAQDPRSAQAHFLLGVAYGRLADPDLMGEAAAEFRQALDLEPALVQARYYLAQVYLDMGRAERARSEMETALKQVPEHPQFLALLGEIERQLGRPNRSLELNRQALKSDAGFAQARYYVGLALLDLKRRDEAIRELEQVVKSGVQLAEVYLSLGAAYLDAGKVDVAVTTLRRGLEIDHSRLDIRVRLARAYRAKGLLADAETVLSESASKGAASQASPAAQQLQAERYLEQGLVRLELNRPKAAIDALQRALELKSDLGPAHLHLARAYIRQGAYGLAQKHAALAEKLGSPLSRTERASLQQKLQKK